MINQRPAKEQFIWEQCGFTWYDMGLGPLWVSPDNANQGFGNPPIDLNNLFKYAVPFLEKKLGCKEAYKLLLRWITGIMDGEDPAEFLFELIYKALGGKE